MKTPIPAGWLVALYPARWRDRYGDELAALLDAEPASPALIVDVLRGALRAHATPVPAGGIPMRSRTPTAASVLAVLLVLPALTFLGAAAVRNMQPSQYQPAHAALQIFDAFGALGPGWFWALLAIAPLVALGVSVAVIWRRLDSDAAAREDLAALAHGLRRIARQPALVLAGLALVASAGVLSFAVVHAIAG